MSHWTWDIHSIRKAFSHRFPHRFPIAFPLFPWISLFFPPQITQFPGGNPKDSGLKTQRSVTAKLPTAMRLGFYLAVNIKIAGKWMFIPLKMVLIGIDPYPFEYIYYIILCVTIVLWR
jgi:hypothetical protein